MTAPEKSIDENRRKITDFLVEIGLDVVERDLPDETFLPGVTIREGELILDPRRLRFPGDLLHEAGHLAVLPPAERGSSSDDFGEEGGYEMAAIAWSYAACTHLELPIDLLFHPDGYKSGSASLIENFTAGRYVGVPILVWRGMTDSSGPTAYPAMREWLCP